MAAIALTTILLVSSTATGALAQPHSVGAGYHQRRAPASSSAAGAAGGGAISTGTFQPIAMSMTSEATSALPTSYSAGATPTDISGAPALPSAALTIANYPALDRIPPTNSPQVQQWLSQVDMSKVPNFGPTGIGGCANTTNAQAVADAGSGSRCWWTCGGCTRQDDITACPTKGTWGTSYDDGPSPDTPKLLQYLDSRQLKTTFFVVGSRVLSRPNILQSEYMDGHQISVHTWSHPPLTTLTNEQIVAELGWSKKVIKDTIGLTPKTFRPPYGDIDDRVRAIAAQMDLQPIIWTSTGTGQTFDTEDWKIAAGTVTPATVLSNFEQILSNYTALPGGFIVLEHDLYTQSVDLAVEFVLPRATRDKGLTLQPIVTCLGMDMDEAYIETASNTTSAPASNASAASGSGGSSASGTGSAQGSSASGGSSSSKSSSAAATACSLVGVSLVAAVGALFALFA